MTVLRPCDAFSLETDLATKTVWQKKYTPLRARYTFYTILHADVPISKWNELFESVRKTAHILHLFGNKIPIFCRLEEAKGSAKILRHHSSHFEVCWWHMRLITRVAQVRRSCTPFPSALPPFPHRLLTSRNFRCASMCYRLFVFICGLKSFKWCTNTIGPVTHLSSQRPFQTSPFACSSCSLSPLSDYSKRVMGEKWWTGTSP